MPANFGSYQERGYFRFNPKTILPSLNQNETDVFTPLLENPDNVPDIDDMISWTESDYLKIANALSQQVWNEPLDLNSWKVYSLSFEGNCGDTSNGFNSFSIAYYRITKVSWKIVYSARLISMQAWHGIVGWGGNETFTAPFLFGWHNIDLLNFKISADDALRIAEENGGREARSGNSKCGTYVFITPNTNIYGSNWIVDYSKMMRRTIINPYNGRFKAIQ